MKNTHLADKYTTLRKRFQAFYYDGYKVSRFQDKITVTFDFYLDDTYEFHPTMIFKFTDQKTASRLSNEHIDQLIFYIGMVELISYWKAACPKQVVIRPYRLDEAQVKFWKKLYFNGLGEFFYTNGIETTQEEFMQISFDTDRVLKPLKYRLTRNYVVLVGGGKDSAVTLQLLKEFKNENTEIIPFIMNPRAASVDTTLQAGFGETDIFRIERTIDPVLLRMNEEGFLNGHTPFSALLAFTSLLVAALTQNAMIALSNESSANEASIPGTGVNHQYSKALEFENDFREYVKRYISDGFEYFSFLRPLTELQISKIFSLYEQYFDDFKSCNVGSKEDRWCGKCPKCLFTYIILSPFLSLERLQNILGHDLLDDPDHLEYYRQLTGQDSHKPFECVGTVDEISLSLALAARKYEDQQKPLIIRDFMETEIYENYKNMSATEWIIGVFHENNLPKELRQKLKKFLLKIHCK